MDKNLRDTIELVSNVTDAYTAALFVYDEGKAGLRIAASHTLSKDFVPDCVLGLGDGIVGWVAKKQKAVNVTHFDQDTGSLIYYNRNVDIKSFLAVPVGDFGVLCVDSKSKYVFVDKDQKILAGFAQTFEHLLKAKRIKEREKSYAKMLKLLYHVDKAVRMAESPGMFMDRVLEEMRDFSGSDLAFFTSLRKGRTDLRVDAASGNGEADIIGRSYGLGSGLVGWVYRRNKSLVIESIRTNGGKSHLFAPGDPIQRFQAFLGLPMVMWGNTVGVMGLVSYETRPWSADDKHVLTMTGQWVASVLGTLAI